MDTSSSTLAPLQREILDVIKGLDGFFLSGGSALAAGYLGHRRSVDIDLFVIDSDDADVLVGTIRAAAAAAGWTVEVARSYPGFKRLSVTKGQESTLVDIVHEVVPQEVALSDKPVIDGIRMDDIRDIVANKLCALLGRGEVRDLVDLYFISKSGVDVLGALPAAYRKDSGIDPAILADVLREVPTRLDDLMLVRSLDESDLRSFRDGLVDALVGMAWPRG